MRNFKAQAGEKCRDAPDNGKTSTNFVKNWIIRAISGRTDTKNEQKPDLCANLRLQQAKNAQTLQIMEKQTKKIGTKEQIQAVHALGKHQRC